MATELPLLPSLALVLLYHHPGRLLLDNIFAGVELQEVQAHRVYLARRRTLDLHHAHYLQFHLHPDPVLDPDPDPVLDPSPTLPGLAALIPGLPDPDLIPYHQ
jgi:hypothetical protein